MMRFAVALTFFASLLLISCSDNRFKIDFNLSEKTNANYSIVYYASDKKGGMIIQTVAPIQGGVYEFTGITVKPVILFLTSNVCKEPTIIYAERGDNIKITGDDNIPYTWMVGGNKINRRLSEWRNENSLALKNGSHDSINLNIARYVETHPSDPASTLLLLTLFDRRIDDRLYRQLWNSLRGDARSAKWTSMIGLTDQPDASPATPPGILKSMVMRAYPEGIDTIFTSHSPATLLLFRYNDTKDRKAINDSLKHLVDEYPDSASRIIAEITLEADSISWRHKIRSDSLKSVRRLWTPAGLADERLMKLKVTRCPFIIVADSAGQQIYRGNEIDSAFKEFRRLMSRQ